MNFQDLNLKEFVLKTIQNLKFKELTKIQEKMIPKILKNQSIIVNSNTGTGKTYGYLLGVINKINSDINKTQTIIILPTKELAFQVSVIIQQFLKNNDKLKMVNLIQNKNWTEQKQKFENTPPHLVIGTPSKLKKMLDDEILNLTTSKMVVIDEVDMIFDLDFINEIDFLLSKMAKDTQFMVFSATINNQLQGFLRKYLPNTKIIDLVDYNQQKNIEHFLIKAKYHNRLKILDELLNKTDPFLCLIFVNKKTEISEVLKLFSQKKIKIGQIHSNLQPRERIKMLKRIKNNEFKYVVCSDIASRGIDLLGVSHVISLNLPYDLTYYFHRAGRTGRGKYHGSSFLFFDSNEEEQINLLIKKGIDFKMWSDTSKTVKTERKSSNIIIDMAQNDLKKIFSKYSSSPIKPGYKKQRQEDIKKVLHKYRKKTKKK